jgi:MFS family permease
MRDYVKILRDHRDYRLIWSGSVLNLLGDGATWTALAWMAITLGSAKAVGVLSICYTLPVILGGAFVGPIIDRFSRRFLLVGDSILRAVVVVTVPIAAALGEVHLWHLYLVAAVYGLLKIVPLGAVPAVVPDLVPKNMINTSAGLEAIAFDVAMMVGPVLGGFMIAIWNAPVVLAFDAATYVLFALCVLAMKNRLPKPETVEAGPGVLQNFGWRPVFRLLRLDVVLTSMIVSFALYNAAMGMLRVAQPWLAAEQLQGGARTLGIILGVSNGAGLIGSVLAGVIKPKDKQMRNIGIFQIIAGTGLAFLFLPGLWAVLAAVTVSSLFSAPMTVCSQVIRVARIPAELRGRMMTFMRTLMNSTSPGGSAIAGPLLAVGMFYPMVTVMLLFAALPGIAVAIAFRKTSFSKELGLEPAPPVAQPVNA